ncbi:hypothetical protein ACJMK2_015517 [Sinanodonta woodiana]|uniref:Stabilin-2 n=1 Tax=Sinanodonta woodiana TaxID=1069815 RepID=A0ABD3UUA1_SINWO
MALRITNSFISFTFSLIIILENVSAQSIYCKNETLTARFKTSCIACSQNYYTRCPAAMKLTSGRGLSDCTYFQEVTFPRPEFARLSGCRHVCEKAIEIQHCCPGRWGKYCDECPGGADTPCNNHGVCNETIYGDGKCTCFGDFSGYACERCANETLYGPNCTEVCQCVHGTCNWGIKGDGSCRCFSGYKGDYCDEVIHDCQNLTCSGRCAEVGGNATCVCDIGYVDTGNGSCAAADPCRPSPCDSNASCIANGTLEYNCTCNYGYQGDGWSCDPVDNCQKDNGGCPANTTVCIYNGPKQIECQCMPGYDQYVSGFGCELKEMCSNVTCPRHSSCKTTGPQQYECICDESYSGRYGQCNGNILQTLNDLNKEDPELMGQLDLIIKMIETYYKPEMMNAVPITLFAPNNNGFRTLPTSNFQKWLNDSVQASQFLRQHTVVGEFTLQDLYNSTVFYTLQGSTAELMARSTKQGEVLRFRLLGDNNKAKIVKGDILASNGVIHVINTLLTNPPEITGDPESSVLEIIINNGRYRRFTAFISAAGLENMFSKENITVFAPTNNAFDSLPVGAQEYLQKPEGLMQLIGFMKNHIVEGTIEAARLINIQFVKAVSSVIFSVNVTSNGQIVLNGNINISQTDIPAKNGLIYDITSVMLPDSGGSLLPGKCDTTKVEMVKGTCVSCQQELTCRHNEDISLGLTSECLYWVNIQGFKYMPFEGCSLWCNRTYHIPRCCPGFYGLDCLPCPGGHSNPCNGNGVCAEGKTEKGTCKCKTNFAGESCDRCSRPNYFGANCSQDLYKNNTVWFKL